MIFIHYQEKVNACEILGLKERRIQVMGSDKMKIVKNILFVILAIFAFIILLAGLFMLMNGSLESFPTEEQIEKVRICGWLFTAIGGIWESICLIVLYKNNKKKH